jgi:hypothetical protein
VGIFGDAAARYAYERATFECLLAIRLMSDRIGKESSPSKYSFQDQNESQMDIEGQKGRKDDKGQLPS